MSLYHFINEYLHKFRFIVLNTTPIITQPPQKGNPKFRLPYAKIGENHSAQLSVSSNTNASCIFDASTIAAYAQ